MRPGSPGPEAPELAAEPCRVELEALVEVSGVIGSVHHEIER
jgi:hypothetical protein